MTGWETILAATGGVVLGIGIGVLLARRGLVISSLRLRRIESRVRASVIPVLEHRAHTLGLTRDQRSYHTEDPFEVAIDLSESIQRFEDSHDMAFSDTLEVQRRELEKKK